MQSPYWRTPPPPPPPSHVVCTIDMPPRDPMTLFERWIGDAAAEESRDPVAASLATIDADGLPNVRMVLCKAYDADGFVFHTDGRSAKGREVSAHPYAALCFHWSCAGRQVRIRGSVRRTSDARADACFARRSRRSRIAAWASRQSRVLARREDLDAAFADCAHRHEDGRIPRPPYWVGFRVVPSSIEFWRVGADRMHDRLVYRRGAPDGDWRTERLQP